MASREARVFRVLKSFWNAPGKTQWIATKIQNQRSAFIWRRFEERLHVEQRRNLAFDREHGTDTAAEMRLTDAGLPADQSVRGNVVYRPVWEADFHAALASLDIDFEGFTFVDVGSGKGKLLLLASDYPFARIIGVEFAPALHDIACRNIGVYGSPRQRCKAIEAVLADALRYELPRGPIVCLMFNAMNPATLKAWLKRVEADLSARRSPAYIVYGNLRSVREAGSAFSDVGGLQRLKRSPKLLVLANDAGMCTSSHPPRSPEQRRPAAP
jgi:hypothetical protein